MQNLVSYNTSNTVLQAILRRPILVQEQISDLELVFYYKFTIIMFHQDGGPPAEEGT